MHSLVVMVIAATGLAALGAGAARAANPDHGMCLISGPYARKVQAADFASHLRHHGLPGKPAQRPTLALFYRVELDGFADLAAAKTAARHLHRDGLHDLYVSYTDAPGDPPSISLGIFRELSDALRRNEQAKILGFHPQILEDYIGVPFWYVEVAAPAAAAAFTAATGAVPRTAPCSLGHARSSPAFNSASAAGDLARIADWQGLRRLYGYLRLKVSKSAKSPPG